MKTIFLMRHGETLFNVMDVNQGQCDSPLTENGINQALAAKEWFKNQKIHFDSVYSSTAERACDTAWLVSGMPYERKKGLKEIFLGTKEASPNSENPEYPYGDYFVQFGGEDLDAFTDRIYGAVREIAREDTGETILIVTHGMAMRRFLRAVGYRQDGTGFIGNCGIVQLQYEEDTFEVRKIINPAGTAQNINILGKFCGKRDVERLTSEQLQKKYGIAQADVMVLFGGSILAGGDILAEAIKEKIAKRYVIVGGVGHTTETLRQKVQNEYSQIRTENLSEAEVFSRYISEVYGCQADFLEKDSTNCGNNITYLLELLKENNLACESIILCQDATMQNRMDAGMKKYAPDIKIINFASYRAEVVQKEGRLSYIRPIHGMWDMDRYVQLLMGEIPRLTDDENGYGSKGKDFIAHVEIPEEVKKAFSELKEVYGEKTREADPYYASK